MPEAVLAREIGLHYAALCPVVNHAAGRGDSKQGIKFEDIMSTLDLTMQQVRNLIAEIARVYGAS